MTLPHAYSRGREHACTAASSEVELRVYASLDDSSSSDPHRRTIPGLWHQVSPMRRACEPWTSRESCAAKAAAMRRADDAHAAKLEGWAARCSEARRSPTRPHRNASAHRGRVTWERHSTGIGKRFATGKATRMARSVNLTASSRVSRRRALLQRARATPPVHNAKV
jgi:hypothetical protein